MSLIFFFKVLSRIQEETRGFHLHPSDLPRGPGLSVDQKRQCKIRHLLQMTTGDFYRLV